MPHGGGSITVLMDVINNLTTRGALLETVERCRQLCRVCSGNEKLEAALLETMERCRQLCRVLVTKDRRDLLPGRPRVGVGAESELRRGYRCGICRRHSDAKFRGEVGGSAAGSCEEVPTTVSSVPRGGEGSHMFTRGVSLGHAPVYAYSWNIQIGGVTYQKIKAEAPNIQVRRLKDLKVPAAETSRFPAPALPMPEM
ncbi:unnamed protein product [Prunus brigantina]